MKVNLPLRKFSFFKVVAGSFFLLATIFSPLAGFVSIVAYIVGRTHALGAWFAMWRAGKLNWKYVVWLSMFTLIVSYYGVYVLSLDTLSFITSLLFIVHFFFDEFDLQEQERNMISIFSATVPFFLLVAYRSIDFFNITSFAFYLTSLAIVFTAIEVVFIKEINWFFIHTKILTAFILLCIYLHLGSEVISSTFLLFHYFFWFIYPVYNLHRYKREERDGLIMILILLMSTTLYYSYTESLSNDRAVEAARRGFLVGTIIHILGTAPFAYAIGLSRKNKYSEQKHKTVTLAA